MHIFCKKVHIKLKCLVLILELAFLRLKLYHKAIKIWNIETKRTIKMEVLLGMSTTLTKSSVVLEECYPDWFQNEKRKLF